MILGDFPHNARVGSEMNKVILWALAMAAACGNSRACEGDAAQWGRDYVALRQVHGHFDGGTWTADVDQWQGRKHRLMQCLAAEFSAPGATTAQLLARMGTPDTRQRCPAKRRCEQWAYHWRGTHDRLVFAVAAGRVKQVDWDLALE
jgi:hypothetical protein